MISRASVNFTSIPFTLPSSNFSALERLILVHRQTPKAVPKMWNFGAMGRSWKMSRFLVYSNVGCWSMK